MSMRTRAALVALGVNDHSHRSRQLTSDDLRDADLIVAMAREHVQFVRRTTPQASARTATLKRLARDLPAGPEPLAERVAALAPRRRSSSSRGRTSTTRPAATRRSSTSAPTRSGCSLDGSRPRSWRRV